jgi:hypothetical protein
MKKCFILLFSILCTTSLMAQEETLIGEVFHSGGYGGPVWKVGMINGKTGMFTGGRGGWIINHKFVFGGGGYSLVSDIETDMLSENGNNLFLDLEFGGLELEYIHNSDKLVHWTIHTMLGRGKATLLEHDPKSVETKDSFYMVIPSFDVDFNINSWFRFGVGASYHLALDLELDQLSNSDVSGLSALIILKFGSF